MLAAALALLASFLWGTSDFGAGLLARRTSFWAVVLVGLTAAAAAMLVAALALHRPVPPATTVLVLVVGGVLSATSGLTFFRALTFTKMSVGAPIIAGAAVVPVLWGLARGEHPDPVQLLGIVITLAGIVVVSLPGPSAPDDDLPVTLTGVLLAATASLCAGLMVVALDYGAAADPVWAVGGVRWSAALWAAAWIGIVRPRLRLQTRLLPLLVLMGLMVAGANLLFAEATTLADLSVVAVLGWIGPAVTMLLARVFLHERLRPRQWVAALSVIAGVVLLTAG